MSEENRTPDSMVVSTLKSEPFQVSIQQALPPGMSKDKFTRAAITAIQKNPSILEGEKNSLYSSLVESANVGLLCDGKQAALVIFNTNVGSKQQPRWIKKVQFMPMVGGIVLNLGRAGVTVDTQVVHENDDFEVSFGDDPRIFHKPAQLGADRGTMIGAYAICRTKDGAVYREVMDKAQIEAVRNQSKAKDSLMWTQFASEGWRKTVLRRCSKRIPIVDELIERTLEADNKTFAFDEEDLPPVDPQSVVATQEESEDPAPPEAQTQAPLRAASPAKKPSPPIRPRALQTAVSQYEEDMEGDPTGEVF
jgi:recombination protein RecT